jgi:protein gp37
VLTKRPQRIARLDLPWLANIWAGTSVEDQSCAWLDHLRAIPRAAVRWTSVEPLLEPVKLNLTDIDSVVIGGESGPKINRPIIEMDPEWARDVVAQARAAGAKVFMKQMGTKWATRYRRFHGPYPKGAKGARDGRRPEY